MYGGSTPNEILLAKREFVRNNSFIRESARWQDFTNSNLYFNNAALEDSVIGDKGQLFGEQAISYISCLGIRKDEAIRVEKIRARIAGAKNEKGKSLFNQPPGEIILAPLIENNISQQDVIDFWKKQSFDLDLSNDGLFSNCVYCPLKGKKKLLKIAMQEIPEDTQTKNTPASIDWWVQMEKKYNRDMKAEKRIVTSKKDVAYIGFFGATSEFVYQKIKQQAALNNSGTAENLQAEYLEDEGYIPCNCTD